MGRNISVIAGDITGSSRVSVLVQRFNAVLLHDILIQFAGS